jgi:hypothetical protein
LLASCLTLQYPQVTDALVAQVTLLKAKGVRAY